MDPVQELGIAYRFYRTNGKLLIDLDSLESQLRRGDIGVLVLIHYFGRVDPGYRAAVALAREFGALVLEDQAHSWLSDVVGGCSGRLGDASIASLHKLLPCTHGGLLTWNECGRAYGGSRSPVEAVGWDPWEFDLLSIAERRRKNARFLREHLSSLGAFVELLWTEEGSAVPQTLPIRILRHSRDRLYHQLNAQGFGVVSLYHTMVDAIDANEFPDSHQLARSILNLPVHQEAKEADLARLVGCMSDLMSENR